jgi:hypothetical protein
MARAENVQTISATAGEALPIYRFVTLQSDGKFDLTDTTDLRADGVTCEEVAADGDTFAMAPCSQPAVMKVTAGETIAVGDLIAAEGGSGKALVASAAGTGQYSLGVALTGGDEDEVIEVLLHLSANQA